MDFVRWVDDYNIFCKTEYQAQSILFGLGEWLYSKHGLTLQSTKTKILPIDAYRREVTADRDEMLTDRDMVVNMLRDFRSGYEGDDEELPDDEEVEAALQVLRGIDLLGMLQRSLADTSLVDYQAVVYALTTLPQIPGASEELKREVLDLVIDNAELLYPVCEQIAKYVLSFKNLTLAERKKIAVKLLRPLKSKRQPPPDYYAMWILSIFASGPEWNRALDIIKLYRSARSEVLRRYAALAIQASGSRADALVIRDDYGAASPLLKLAILFASQKLGTDERRHWKLAEGVSGALEKLI